MRIARLESPSLGLNHPAKDKLVGGLIGHSPFVAEPVPQLGPPGVVDPFRVWLTHTRLLRDPSVRCREWWVVLTQR